MNAHMVTAWKPFFKGRPTWLTPEETNDLNSLNQVKAIVNRHRSVNFVTCPEDCWCWDMEAAVDAAMQRRRE